MKNYRVIVNGTEYEVAIEELAPGAAAKAAAPAPAPAAAPAVAPASCAAAPTADKAFETSAESGSFPPVYATGLAVELPEYTRTLSLMSIESYTYSLMEYGTDTSTT